MAQETVTILRVGTDEAVKSINDLKENVKLLKASLGELEIGTEEYQNTLDQLKVNQNALRDAMYATSSTMEDVAASATGASESYNSLVHRMAALKEEWRSTNDEARRNELGEQIAQINQQLKDMDASVGNFQRNVGNYESGVSGLVAKFDAWGETLKIMPPTLGAAKDKMGQVGETMQLIGKQPILGIIGLLAPIIIKITESLKDNQTAMDAVKRAMAALQPVFDVLEGVLEAIATGLAKAVDWLIELVGESDGMKKVTSAVAGVGNAILQYLLVPIKSAIAAFKGIGKIIGDVFKGNFKDIKVHAKEAGEGIADAWKDGFSFKANFEEGKSAGAKFVAGVADNKDAAKKAGEEIGEEIATAVENELVEIDWDKVSAANAKRIAAEQAVKEAAAKEQQELNDMVEADWEATNAEIDAYFEDMWETQVEDAKRQRELAQAKIDSMYAVADATSSVLGSLASMYESDEENAEKNAGKIKALRIAEATINTISGAIGAFMQSVSSTPPPFGQIIGAANAAAVTAAGMVQIGQLRNTSVTGSSGSASGIGEMSINAPNVDTELQSVRNITSASEEERLNRMAQSQRVYILQSDIEAAGNQSRAQVAESSF